MIHGPDCAWESTRQGKLKFYISRWTEVAASALDLMVQEILRASVAVNTVTFSRNFCW